MVTQKWCLYCLPVELRLRLSIRFFELLLFYDNIAKGLSLLQDGYTSLQEAVRKGFSEVVSLLLAKGAKTETIDKVCYIMIVIYINYFCSIFNLLLFLIFVIC